MLTEYFHNSHKDTKHYPNELCSVLKLDNTAVAFEEIKTWNGYSETPLHSLDVIAENIGVKSIYYKDGKLDMKKEMVLFCAGGLRSALAAKSLKDMGFEKVSHINGGFGAIRQSKFKIV